MGDFNSSNYQNNNYERSVGFECTLVEIDIHKEEHGRSREEKCG
jgi:hypothetical protein